MKSLIVVLFFVLFCITGQAQQKFIKTIDDNTYGNSIRVLPTSDLGWVVFSLDSLKLTKFNSCGINTWTKKYALPGISTIYGLSDFIKTNTGGFAFLTRLANGNTNSSLITKLDAAGNIIWCKSFEDSFYNQFPYTLNLDNQGNFILYGNVDHINNGTLYNMICKINPNGSIIWTNFYDHGGIWGGAIATSDNGILARTGNTFIKTDNSGNVEWTSQFTSSAIYNYFAAFEVSDGYIFSSYNSSGAQFINFCKMDLQGNLIQEFVALGLKRTDFVGIPPSMRRKSNGNFSGVFNKIISGKNYPTVVEFDKDLNIINQSSINLSASGTTLFGKDICFSDNGFPVLAGTDNGSSSPFFAKMNSAFNTTCDTSLNMNITLDVINQSFIATNVISYNLNVVDKNVTVDSFSVSQTNLCLVPLYLNIGNDTLICENSTLTLQNTTNDLFDTYLWSTGETTSTITTNQPGTYWLLATYNCGANTLSDTVQIRTKPAIAAYLGEDLLDCENTKIIFTAPYCNSCNYFWSTGSTSDSIEITEQGTYWLKVENSNGCISSDTIDAAFVKCECDFYIPNAFTPNNNELNDLFKPVYYCDFNDYNLKIFNRWGELIFMTDNKETAWNGKFKSQLVQEGIYVYTINYTPVIKGKLKNSIQIFGTIAVIY